jgi:hypothetical protein
MRTRSVSVSDELMILKACVMDTQSLKHVASVAEDIEFKLPTSRLVFKWCLNHLDTYDEAPGKENVASEFLKWSSRQTDDEVVERCEEFLDSVDDSSINQTLVEDKIGEHFSKHSLRDTAEQVLAALDKNDVRHAQDLTTGWRPVEVGKDASISVLTDKEALEDVFNFKKEALIEYPKDLGTFFGNDLCRDAFIAFQAPEKRGKTFWLQDIAWQGINQNRKVAFIGLGDMTQRQYMERFAIRASRLPRYSCELQIPSSLEWTKWNKEYDISYKPATKFAAATAETAWQNMDKIMNRSGHKQPLLKLAAYPNSTMGVSNIEGVLDLWERDGWIPDVIVIDYADLLLPPRGASDERSANNTNWKQLRKISQERHLLMVTATQASAQSYDSYVVTRSHFSEDKRKLAHVTAMIGLNQTEDEADDGVMRLNWIARRDEAYSPYNCCLVAGRREVGNLRMLSHYTKTDMT